MMFANHQMIQYPCGFLKILNKTLDKYRTVQYDNSGRGNRKEVKMKAKYTVLYEDGSIGYVKAYDISEAWELATDSKEVRVKDVWLD